MEFSGVFFFQYHNNMISHKSCNLSKTIQSPVVPCNLSGLHSQLFSFQIHVYTYKECGWFWFAESIFLKFKLFSIKTLESF